MTDKQKQRAVREAFERWIGLFGLERWHFEIEYKTNDDADYHAQCDPDYAYRRCSVEVNLSGLDEDDIESTVVHELLHCVLAPLWFVACDLAASDEFAEMIVDRANEEVTTALSQAFILLAGGA